jgi:hypothetical protein
MLEIDWHEHEAVGDSHSEIGESAPLPGLSRRMVDLEHGEVGAEVRASIGEGVKTCPQDDVLIDALPGLLLDNVLCVPGAHADPPAERMQVVLTDLGPQLVPDGAPFVPGQFQRKSVIENQRRWFLTMEIAGDRSDKRRSARSSTEGRHTADHMICVRLPPGPAACSVGLATWRPYRPHLKCGGTGDKPLRVIRYRRRDRKAERFAGKRYRRIDWELRKRRRSPSTVTAAASPTTLQTARTIPALKLVGQ